MTHAFFSRFVAHLSFLIGLKRTGKKPRLVGWQTQGVYRAPKARDYVLSIGFGGCLLRMGRSMTNNLSEIIDIPSSTRNEQRLHGRANTEY